MDGTHDLGGREGFGPLPLEDNEPVFHHDWEGRVLGMRQLMGFWHKWNIDAGRHSIEKLPPDRYLTYTYYEKWLAGMVNISVEAGLITKDEVATGHPAPGSEKATPPATPQDYLDVLAKGRPSAREINAAPAFAVGDQVRTAAHGHSGHTRLPGYMRGCVGKIVLHHGAHVLPDVAATMTGEAPEHLYAVRFTGPELYGSDTDPKMTVTADLWESYLAAAS